MKILWPTGTMSFVKRGKLLALLLTFINLIALKIYENEILEDSLINNFSNTGFLSECLTIPAELTVLEMVDLVKNDKDLLEFATELIALNGDVGYVKPGSAWDSGTITTDLMQNLNEGIRAKHLEKWQDNVDEIFSEENFNKIEAAKGPEYVDVLKRTLARMKSGRNRFNSGSKAVDNLLDWLNNSVGVIMFLNVRSAVLQTISTVNYINWHDNNPLKAAKAFANQPQFWKDFVTIYNSEYLKIRRKYFIVIIFAAAAILTPPDPITQIGLAIPLLILYELSIISVKLTEKNRDKENA